MSFVRVCALDEIAADEAHKVVVGRYDIAVARYGDEVFALQDLCSHAAVPLSEGEVADGTIECFLHGSCFDLRTGKPTHLPATEPVTTFPVELRGDDHGVVSVWVDADTTLNGVTPR